MSDGVIVYPGDRSESASWWKPSRVNVLAAEKALRAAVPNSPVAKTRVGRELARYKRQYQGFRKDGEKMITIIGTGFTLFVVPSIYVLVARTHRAAAIEEAEAAGELEPATV